jgi:hypothetical protein
MQGFDNNSGSFASLNASYGHGKSRFGDSNINMSDFTKFNYNPSFNMNPPAAVALNHNYKQGHMGLANKMNRSQSNRVKEVFFGKKNIERIQKMIRREVYNRTHGKYVMDCDQDINKLIVAMEDVYDEYGRNLPHKTIRQVKALNQHLIDSIVPDMITAVKSYYGYLKDITSPLQHMDRPLNVNNAGRNSLPSVTTIWENRGYDPYRR